MPPSCSSWPTSTTTSLSSARSSPAAASPRGQAEFSELPDNDTDLGEYELLGEESDWEKDDVAELQTRHPRSSKAPKLPRRKRVPGKSHGQREERITEFRNILAAYIRKFIIFCWLGCFGN